MRLNVALQQFPLTDPAPALTFPPIETPVIPAQLHKKEGMTMSESKTSQVRDAVTGAWKKMVDEQVARVELACGEAVRMQEQALAQNHKAIDEMAKLSRESVDYLGQLSTSFWKLTLEATRKTADLVTFQG